MTTFRRGAATSCMGCRTRLHWKVSRVPSACTTKRSMAPSEAVRQDIEQRGGQAMIPQRRQPKDTIMPSTKRSMLCATASSGSSIALRTHVGSPPATTNCFHSHLD
jgi:hypothetical protein